MKFAPQLHKLSNGLTVILDPMDLETINFKVLFCTGSRDEKPNEYGLTHFCEHISIVTQGADFDADLGAVWRENFK